MKKKIHSFTNISELLKIVKNDNFPVDIMENEMSNNSPAMYYASELEKNIVDIAIENKYVIGLDTNYFQNYVPVIISNSPVLTPEGVSYLSSQSIWNKYPIIEKLLIILLTGAFSAVTTLLINHFTN